MSNPAIKKAFEYENYFTNDDILRREYEKREDAIRDENSRLSNALDEGIVIGVKKTKRDNAINLLKLGVDVNIIAQGVGLSVQDIEDLKRNL